MKTTPSLALVFVLTFAPACAPKVDDPADVQAITRLMQGYFQAANIKDTAALQALLTDETILFEPHMAPLAGKEAIGKMHEAFLGSFSTNATATVGSVRVAGDLAVAHGTYAETVTPKDATLAAVRASGHWMAVLKRQAGGGWKWDWVMANSDQPMPGTTAGGAEEQALMEIERGFAAAAKNHDMAFFERTLAKEYAQVVDGKPVNVARQLVEMNAGTLQLESLAIRDMRVHVVGDAAIVSMAAESTGTYKGKPFSDRAKGVDVFVKRDGRWQIVNSQMTTIKE